MTIAANYPTIRPSLLLDFANTQRLDPRITFTRTTTATYYDGVTTAKAEENLMRYSQEFDNAVWTPDRATITANNITAPDGSNTAELLTEDTTTNTRGIGVAGATAITFPAGTYTASIFVQAGTGQYCSLAIADNTGASYVVATFDLTGAVVVKTGTTGGGWSHSASSITNVGGGWFRLVLTGVAGASFNRLYFATNNSDNPTYTNYGRQSYLGTGATYYIWGAQLEQRSSVTSYTATTTQPITNYIPVLQTAAAGVARFDHNPTTGESLGLLVEEQRTNLLTYSEQFDNAVWTKTRSSITTNTIVAPNGTLTGDKLVENTDNNSHFVRLLGTISSATYICSVYAKAAERSWMRVQIGGSTQGVAYFDLSTGAVGTVTAGYSASIIAVGNGWFRCVISGTAATTGSTVVAFDIAQSNGTESYQGNGYSGIYIWGAQLEAGAFPTSYIPTTSATVTRNADAASMTGTNFSSWFNNGEGSFYHELNTPNNFTAFANFGASDGSTSNQIGLQLSSTQQVRGIVKSSDTSSFAANLGNIPSGFYKVSMAYKFNDAAICLNAGAVTTDTSVDVPNNMNQISISGQSNSANGHIRKLAYYPIRVTDAQLQALTS